MGFQLTFVDPCLYYRWIDEKYWLMTLVVDDMILATNDTTGRFGRELGKLFEVKNMGDLAWCLGMQISRSSIDKCVFCLQEAYYKKILRDLAKHLEERKPVSMPRDGNKKLSKDQCIIAEPGKAAAFPLASAERCRSSAISGQTNETRHLVCSGCYLEIHERSGTRALESGDVSFLPPDKDDSLQNLTQRTALHPVCLRRCQLGRRQR